MKTEKLNGNHQVSMFPPNSEPLVSESFSHICHKTMLDLKLRHSAKHYTHKELLLQTVTDTTHSGLQMSIYKTVVNDNGIFRGMYSYSNDTLDVIETPSFEKPTRSSLRKIIFCLSPRSRHHHHHRLSRSPGIHRFRVWLNNKPILAFPQLSTDDSKSTGQASDSFQYEPFRTVQEQKKLKNSHLLPYSTSLRSTLRQWIHQKRGPYLKEPASSRDSLGSQNDLEHKIDGYSTSTLTDDDGDDGSVAEAKTKHSKGRKSNLNLRDFYSPNVLFDGPTAIMQ